MTRTLEAVRIKQGDRRPSTETVAREETLCLYVNGNLLVRLLASPSHFEDLAVGFLFSEGVIPGVGDVLSIQKGSARNTLFVRTSGSAPDGVSLSRGARTSGCGGGITLSDMRDRIEPVATHFKVGADEILALAREFEASSILFRQTGCVHACALASGGRITLLREDIGRHNALDKVIGAALRRGIDPSGSIVLISGRISSEMVAKSARSRLGVIVSRTAPTSTAVEMASEMGVCVVGFVRGGRMNVYTHADRIV